MRHMRDLGGLAIVVIALAVVGRIALEGSESALGAMIGAVAAGVGYFLRGRVESQGNS